jgi:hypothetical protein
MPTKPRLLGLVLVIALIVGTLAGLVAARYRLHAEGANRRIEMALEWDEVSRLSQFTHQSVENILSRFSKVDVSALVIQEDTFTTLEQAGLVHPTRIVLPNGRQVTHLDGLNNLLFSRIRTELGLRGVTAVNDAKAAQAYNVTTFTQARVDDSKNDSKPDEPTAAFTVPVDYANLRTIGVGLPAEACSAAAAAHLQIAGRIANFPGVDVASANNVLHRLAEEGVSIVIFNGEEVLGYRDMEPQVAEMLKDGSIPVMNPAIPGENAVPAQSLAYGAVEFGKQKGDEKLSAKLNGDLIRVHSIQAGEMGQLDREEAIDRFAKAARERNIRFCYIRLLTFAGPDPVSDNIKFVNGIARAIHKGSTFTGGDLQFGPAKRYKEVGTPRILYPFLGIGVAAGTVWMIVLLLPLGGRPERILLVALGILLAIISLVGGELGRKLTALLAGISFPAAACLFTYPSPELPFTSSRECMKRACKAIATASCITAIGIIHVIGLLASRPYMVHISQYLGIKAQHAVPLFIIAFIALIGGSALPGEKLGKFLERARFNLREAMSEPARFGVLLFGLVALAALALIIARTGNDAGVGVSGIELKARAILDRVMPVRPRTKEFLVGHPAYILGICWWLRGRRKAAIPAFVIGSLGQVSLLNTFCHIHTPLIVSAWRGGTGLVVGCVIGLALFALGERLLSEPVR